MSTRPRRLRAFSLLLRRSHMYLALFLTPWMLMYALSTFCFTHYTQLGMKDRFVKERELRYDRVFPEGTKPRAVGERVLEDLGLAGSFSVDQREEGRLVFNRMDPVTPRRITYADKTLTVERQEFDSGGFLLRLHSRVGFGSKFATANLWAAAVDLTVLTTLLWLFSGFWMWWELKKTRRWGAVSALLGVAIFVAFLVAA